MQHNRDNRGAQQALTNAQRTAAAHTRALQAAEYTELLLTQALMAISRAVASGAAVEATVRRTLAQRDQPARHLGQPE